MAYAKKSSQKYSHAGACRGVVFGGGITPDLTAPGVTPEITAPLKIFTNPTYFEAPPEL